MGSVHALESQGSTRCQPLREPDLPTPTFPTSHYYTKRNNADVPPHNPQLQPKQSALEYRPCPTVRGHPHHIHSTVLPRSLVNLSTKPCPINTGDSYKYV